METPRGIEKIYLYLTVGNTLAASFIWGINTIFLLDAGLSNVQAFAANAFFTAGQVLFEVPTGIIADTWGRRASYLLGTVTLSASTLLYLLQWEMHGPFWGWAASSLLLGLGFTFFSGAVEAWLVDALREKKYTGSLEKVFSRGQVWGGAAMLLGSLLGGVIAQVTNLGVPYFIRSAILVINFIVAFFLMKDVGFSPRISEHPYREMKKIFKSSIDNGLKNPSVRFVMLAAPFTTGVSFYIFYALQPFLLELYGNEKAYGVAGLAAALVAAAQIAGGLLAPYAKTLFSKRTSALITIAVFGTAMLVLVGFVHNFYGVIVLIFLWGLAFAAMMPLRQTYIHGLIPSSERATVISFDSMIGSAGGIFIQPILGKAADVWSYSASYLVSAVFEGIAIPFLIHARKQHAPSDEIPA